MIRRATSGVTSFVTDGLGMRSGVYFVIKHASIEGMLQEIRRLGIKTPNIIERFRQFVGHRVQDAPAWYFMYPNGKLTFWSGQITYEELIQRVTYEEILQVNYGLTSEIYE